MPSSTLRQWRQRRQGLSADVGGGEKPGSGGQVTPARQDDRVAETVLPGGAAHGAGEYAVFLGQLDHARTSR